MAQRQSVDRRWSRRSGNLTELDQDSEHIDTENPVWWKDIQDVTIGRASTQADIAETTGPILETDSLVDGSELQNGWWDRLDKTNRRSFGRFSTGRSIIPENTVQESLILEEDDDFGIKKQKVSQVRQNDGTKNDGGHSEILPSNKRKSPSLTRSKARLPQRKIQYRRSLVDAARGDTSINTSNDVDILTKARPKTVEEQGTEATSRVYDEILAHEGPSVINSGKNDSRSSDSPSVKSSIKPRVSFFNANSGNVSKEAVNMSEDVMDLNEFGFMRPPNTGSHRKKFSTISKMSHMTSDESEGDTGLGKVRYALRQKSPKNDLLNPFEEIHRGQLNDGTSSGEASNKKDRASNAATRMSKDLKQSQTRRVLTRVVARPKVYRQCIESDESSMEDDAKNLENTSRTLDKNANESYQSFYTVENIDEDASITDPSEPIPMAPILTALQQKNNSFLGNNSTARTQKNITNFFPSKFLQKTNNSKTLGNFKSFDKKKLDLIKKEVEMKRQRLAVMRIEEAAKKKGMAARREPRNSLKAKKLRQKNTEKPSKVVDKAYIVNGQVYKRPKLPRPKPWVTDRLYRYLWKRLELKYDSRTRIKSESFVVQLAEVVALVIRRKKYDNYKAEVDILMKEMARLNIIKTRNDFYDFCYEYLPYDFRVKVTPMLLPGNRRIVPYDPAKLHTLILSEKK